MTENDGRDVGPTEGSPERAIVVAPRGMPELPPNAAQNRVISRHARVAWRPKRTHYPDVARLLARVEVERHWNFESVQTLLRRAPMRQLAPIEISQTEDQLLDAPADPCFGTRLRELRQSLDIKQIVLSKSLGCSDAAISLWETGTRLPRPRMFTLLLKALVDVGVATSELYALRARWHHERMLRILVPALPAAFDGEGHRFEPS